MYKQDGRTYGAAMHGTGLWLSALGVLRVRSTCAAVYQAHMKCIAAVSSYPTAGHCKSQA